MYLHIHSRRSLAAALMALMAITGYSGGGEDLPAKPGVSSESGASRVFGDLLIKTCKSDALEWIPEQKRLLIPAKVNGKDAKFKIDTGALGTLLTLKSAKARELPVIDFNATFSGVGGTGKVYGSRVQRLQLGGSVDLEGQRVAVVDLPVLEGIDGLIGGETLSGTKAIIDYRQHRMHVPMKGAGFDLEKAAVEAGMLVTKLEREGSYVFLTMTCGKEAIRLLVDSGATRTVIGTKAADRLKLEVKESAERAVGAGGKAMAIQFAKIDVLAAGKAEFRDIACAVMPLDYLAGYSKAGIDGILGADCLAASGAVLSVADSMMVLPVQGVVVSAGDKDSGGRGGARSKD